MTGHRGRTLGAILLATGLTVALAALSQVPERIDRSTQAVLRLAWRTRGVRIDECRAVSAEEQARLPVHMRRQEVCEGRLLPHRLLVEVDGRRVIDQEVRPSGAREDRPIYVFRDIHLGPGTYAVDVRFSRDSLSGDEQANVTPTLLEFEQPVALGPGEIVLITYDPDRKALVLGGNRQ